MSLINDEAEFLREVIGEALNAPVQSIGIKRSPTEPREKWPTTQAIVIGGFAVHQVTQTANEEWTVTHIKSGRCGHTFGTLFEALVTVGIYIGSGAAWDAYDGTTDTPGVDQAARQRIKAGVDRITAGVVDFVGEVSAPDEVVSAA